MNATAQFVQLHERLTMDESTPFIVILARRDNPKIRHTEEGAAWHLDHHRYLSLWNEIQRDGIRPDKLLNEKFGYIPEEDDVPKLKGAGAHKRTPWDDPKDDLHD